MSKNAKKALGKGLDSLLGGLTITPDELMTSPEGYMQAIGDDSSLMLLPIESIQPNPDQPRREFDADKLEELAESIKHLGIVQPITVVKRQGDEYMIVAGERRYRAAQLAGLHRLPAYIRPAEGSILEMALVENVQREDLNPIEIAIAYQGLVEELSLSHEAVAQRVGKKRATVSNYLRLLRLPAEVQLGLSSRLLEVGHAKALLQVEEPDRLIELYRLTIRDGLSVREVEEIARAIAEEKAEGPTDTPAEVPVITEPKKSSRLPEEYRLLEANLSKVFASKVALKYSPKGKGSISISFKNEEELERLMLLLERIQHN